MPKEEKDWTRNIIQPLLWAMAGALTGLAVSLVLLGVAALGISLWGWEEAWMGRMTVAACVTGSGAGGLLTGGENSGRPLLHGSLSGLFFFILLLLGGILLYDVTDPGREALILLAACLCGGALSGLARGGGKGKRKRASLSRTRTGKKRR